MSIETDDNVQKKNCCTKLIDRLRSNQNDIKFDFDEVPEDRNENGIIKILVLGPGNYKFNQFFF